jgi:cyanophycinase
MSAHVIDRTGGAQGGAACIATRDGRSLPRFRGATTMTPRPCAFASTLAVALALAAAVSAAPPATPGTRLVLVGGGDRPGDAVARFVDWAGGASARILVLTWASGEPKESGESLAAEMRELHAAEVVIGPEAVLDAKGRAAPLEAAKLASASTALARATGVFFTGGDQVRVMDALGSSSLLGELRARYAAGTVFGGTSAGTAIMSPIMITGEGDFTVIDAAKVEVKPGLGLLPGVIVDQHFVKRLFGLILAHPELRGVGINEDTALLVTDGRHGEVVGVGPVMLVDARGADRLEVRLLRPGQKVDLGQR